MNPVPVFDDKGRQVGEFDLDGQSRECRTAPPPMTPEQRAELQRRIDDRENSLTLDELLSSLDLEDPSPDSES